MWLRKNFDPFKPFDIRLRFSPSQRFEPVSLTTLLAANMASMSGTAVVAGGMGGGAMAAGGTAGIAGGGMFGALGAGASAVAPVAAPAANSMAAFGTFAQSSPFWTSSVPGVAGLGGTIASSAAPPAAGGLMTLKNLANMSMIGGMIAPFLSKPGANAMGRTPLTKGQKALLGKPSREAKTITERGGGGRGAIKVTEVPAREGTGLIGTIEREGEEAERGKVNNMALPYIAQSTAIAQKAEAGASSLAGMGMQENLNVGHGAIGGNTFKAAGDLSEAQFQGARGQSDIRAGSLKDELDRTRANKHNLMAAESFSGQHMLRGQNVAAVQNARRSAAIGHGFSDAFAMQGSLSVFDAVQNARKKS